MLHVKAGKELYDGKNRLVDEWGLEAGRRGAFLSIN